MSAEKEKEPFDKIRSAHERRILFAQAVTEESSFLCKLGEETLFQFTPLGFDGDRLRGKMTGYHSAITTQELIGNFSVGTDRYFFVGQGEFLGDQLWVSLPTAELFRLQRRKTLRIRVPMSYRIAFNLTQVGDKKVYYDAFVYDLSSGGVRIFFALDLAVLLQVGTKIHGFLHAPGRVGFQIEGVVRHVLPVQMAGREIQHYGIEVVEQGVNTSHRMAVLSLELQRRLITK